MHIYSALSSNAALYVYALLLAIVGLITALRCMFHNYNPERVRVVSVLIHLVVCTPVLYAAGLCATAAKLGGVEYFDHALTFGWIVAMPLAIIGVLICAVPSGLALWERRTLEPNVLEEHYKNEARELAGNAPWALPNSATPKLPGTNAPRQFAVDKAGTIRNKVGANA